MTLVYLFSAWAAGIALTRALGTPLPWWIWMGLAWCAAIVWVFVHPRGASPRQRDFVATGLACLSAFCFGGMALTLATPNFDPGDLAAYNGTGWVTITGTVTDMPDERDSHVNLQVQAESIRPPNEDEIAVSGSVLVQAPRGQTYRYGDQVLVRGTLLTPPSFDEFSYRDYLARQGVYSLMQYTSVDVLEEQRGGNPLFALLSDFRQFANTQVVRLLPDPAASLLAGILLGIETGISPDVREAFNAVGATHVIAISGSNLVILAGLISASVGRFASDRLTALVTVVVIVGYAIFVGADAAVMRAAIMVTLVVIAGQLNRETFGLASLAFAGFIMSIPNPLILWDVGFQLSFLATLGLILYVDPMQTGLERLLSGILPAERAQQIVGALSDAFIVTIAAQITTTPIMAFHFGRISILSLPVNLLIIPAQTPLMVLGGIGVLLSMVFYPLGQVVTWGSYLFLMWTVGVVRLFAAMPLASVEVEVSALSTALIYLIMFGGTAVAMMRETRRETLFGALGRAFGVKAVAAAGLITAAVVLLGACSLPDGRLHVRFLDVGEGQATLITTPSGRHILVDAGPSGRRLSTEVGRALPFWVRRIDLIVLTQPNTRNLGGLAPILRRYEVGAVMTNGAQGDTRAAEEVYTALEGVPIMVAQPGALVTIDDGVRMEVLYAPTNPIPEGESGDPIVLMVSYGQARFLLTGHMEEPVEQSLLQHDWRLHAAVLQVPRGGHESVSGEPMLGLVAPQVSVISVDEGNRFGLPHEETLTRLSDNGGELYRTDQNGTVHMWTDGKRLWVSTRR